MLKKDPLHIHDSWCDVNRNTPVLAKTKQDKTKKPLNLFKPLNLATINYQFIEVTTERGTS